MGDSSSGIPPWLLPPPNSASSGPTVSPQLPALSDTNQAIASQAGWTDDVIAAVLRFAASMGAPFEDFIKVWNRVRDQEVGGSNPLAPTIISMGYLGLWVFIHIAVDNL